MIGVVLVLVVACAVVYGCASDYAMVDGDTLPAVTVAASRFGGLCPVCLAEGVRVASSRDTCRIRLRPLWDAEREPERVCEYVCEAGHRFGVIG